MNYNSNKKYHKSSKSRSINSIRRVFKVKIKKNSKIRYLEAESLNKPQKNRNSCTKDLLLSILGLDQFEFLVC